MIASPLPRLAQLSTDLTVSVYIACVIRNRETHVVLQYAPGATVNEPTFLNKGSVSWTHLVIG